MVVEGLLTHVGLGVLGWGFGTRGGVRILGRPSHGGSRLTALDAHVFEGGPSVLRWVHGVCFSLWWRGSRWCEAVDEAVLDRVLGWWSLLARVFRVECYFFGGCLLWV